MTTHDPFAAPPGPESTSPDPAAQPAPEAAPAAPAAPPATPAPAATAPAATAPAQPGVLAPGLLTPQAAPPAPPVPGVGGFTAPAGPPPAAPNSLAMWALITTGLYTLISLGSALLAPMIVDELKDTLADPENASVNPLSSLLGLFGNAVAIAAFVCLALWMARIRTNRTRLGDNPGGPPAVEWWGWFVPFANFVLPLLGMRAISRRIVGWGLLLGWWIPFCLMWIVTPISMSAQFRAIDFSTGELADEAVLDQMVPLAWASGILLAISWLFLVPIIRKTTTRHLSS